MTLLEIGQRMVLAILMSAAIGFDREFKNRPAGMRTHILVCVGASIIALIQVELVNHTLEMVEDIPSAATTLRADSTRLIAQVVSGIGFLGAGTIIVTKQSITGLTTAASLWAVACLGIAAGMGLYKIALVGFVVIQIVLSLLNKLLVDLPSLKRIQIKFKHRVETKTFIQEYFQGENVQIKEVDFDVSSQGGVTVYTNVYTVELPRGTDVVQLIEEMSLNNNILQIRLIDA